MRGPAFKINNLQLKTKHPLTHIHANIKKNPSATTEQNKMYGPMLTLIFPYYVMVPREGRYFSSKTL